MTLFGDLTFDSEFEAFWKSGKWRKLGKLEAHQYFRDTVKTEQDWIDIQKARDNYATYLQENPWCHAKMGEFWFKPRKNIPYWHRFVESENSHGVYNRFVKQ